MKARLEATDVVAILMQVADDVTRDAERLRELDAAIGDGDLGITVTIGFQAVREGLGALADSDIGTVLMRSGMAFNRKAASTFGALFATMMIGAAKASKGLSSVGLTEVSAMFSAAAQGVRERGKASLGDKTLLDALIPASEALATANQEGLSLGEALARAEAAAEKGMLATAGMKSKIGRSSWFAERTLGTQDPGATAIYLMLRSLSAYVCQAPQGEGAGASEGKASPSRPA